MRLRSIPRKLRTLSGAGAARQALVAEAALGMFLARFSLLVRPFSRVSRGFGVFVAPGDPRVGACAPAGPAQARIARDIGWAIRAAAPFMPFRSVCLQQAMAAHAMLRRRGIHSVMHFGAGRRDGAHAGKATARPIDAHAWLDAGGIRVTGYPVAANLAELGCFV